MKYETRSPRGSQARVISATHFRNIQTSSGQDAVALCSAKVAQAPAQACCRWAMLRKQQRKGAQEPHRGTAAQAEYLCSCAHEGGQALPPAEELSSSLTVLFSSLQNTALHFSAGNLTFLLPPACLCGASIKSGCLNPSMPLHFYLCQIVFKKHSQV